MKYLLFILSFTLIIPFTTNAKGTTCKQTIPVNGNCGECKTRIEEAAYSVAGVKEATWNKKTKELFVVFNSTKTNINAITEAIAKVGHDANGINASNATYKSLPSCCAYRDGKCAHD